jgi:hypothetical protein
MPWSNQAVSLVVIIAGGGFTGLFVYSPAPGAGNLIYSVAAAAGTDPYGNAYQQGAVTYGALGVYAQMLQGSFDLSSASGSTTIQHAAALNLTDSVAAGAQPIMNLISPGALTLAASGRAEIWLAGESADATVPAQVITDTLTAFDPSVAAHSQAETWHTLGGGLGIANLTSDHGRYRLTPWGDVEVDVLLRATGAVASASGTFANSLVSAYRPAFTRSYPLGGPLAAGLGRVLVSTAGAVTVTVPNLNSGNVMGTTIIMPTD